MAALTAAVSADGVLFSLAAATSAVNPDFALAYGSPLANVLDFDSYGSPKSDPLTEKSSSKEPTFSGKLNLFHTIIYRIFNLIF